MRYLLGVDLGTSGTKTVLFDETGKVIASKTVEYPLLQPKNGWAEQDPQMWWDNAKLALKKIMAESGAKGEDILWRVLVHRRVGSRADHDEGIA